MNYRILLLLVIGVLVSSAALAQSSPAFDPNVYLPKMGQEGFDTVHLKGEEGKLGTSLYNVGPSPEGGYGRIVMTGLPNDPPFLSMIETGPGFSLPAPHVVQDLHFVFNGSIVRRAHLHTSMLWDVIVDQGGHDFRIYWADSEGFYDSTNWTDLSSDYSPGFANNLYVTTLVSDSVDDIVSTNSSQSFENDTLYVLFFRGGNSLYQQKHRALPDSVYNIAPIPGRKISSLVRNFSQGDWRGVGRSDAIGVGYNYPAPWFFYRNDPPFSLQKFCEAMLLDTIFTISKNPGYEGGGSFGENITSLRALPKPDWDRSEDFMPSIPLSASDRTGSIYIFRGGSDFGTHRLYLDSAAVVITNPKHYDPSMTLSSFWGTIYPCGDMTGSGRPVIYIPGDIGFDQLNFFYVLGNAADDKVDIYFNDLYASGSDSLTGDFDSREDQLFGNRGLSRLMLLHGSDRIPTHINPKLERAIEPAQISTDEIGIYPNPCVDHATLRLTSDRASDCVLRVHNVLGQEMLSEHVRLEQGINSLHLALPALASGEYLLTLENEFMHRTARLTVVR